MALASDAGNFETSWPKGLMRPDKVSATAQTRKAPTATGNPPSTPPVVTKKAAPGVVHAQLTGLRVTTAKIMQPRPIAMADIIMPDAASALFAPMAFKPCSTIAKELAKPTNAASRPVKLACIEKSRSNVLLSMVLEKSSKAILEELNFLCLLRFFISVFDGVFING